MEEQRVRAKLVEKAFELGIVTDEKPSKVLDVVINNLAVFEALGMKKYHWQDDALRSHKKVSGEQLLFSISAVR